MAVLLYFLSHQKSVSHRGIQQVRSYIFSATEKVIRQNTVSSIQNHMNMIQKQQNIRKLSKNAVYSSFLAYIYRF